MNAKDIVSKEFDTVKRGGYDAAEVDTFLKDVSIEYKKLQNENEELEKKLDIQIMNFKVAMGDDSYTSRIDFDNEKFYKMLDDFDGIPVTSQITAFEYQETFEKLYSEGYTDVINTTINSKGSATYNNAVMAAEEFYSAHPEAKGKFTIYNIDGESYTGAYGYAVVQGAMKATKDVPAADIVAFMEDWIKNCVIFFAPYTLKYANKSGRIPSAAGRGNGS